MNSILSDDKQKQVIALVNGIGGFAETFTLAGTQVTNGVMNAVGTLTGNILGQLVPSSRTSAKHSRLRFR